MQAVMMFGMFLLGANCGYLISMLLPRVFAQLCMLASGALIAFFSFVPVTKWLMSKPCSHTRSTVLTIASVLRRLRCGILKV